MPSSQLVILARTSTSSGELPPLGTRREILEQLESRNTSPERAGDDMLYGPGIEIELPPEQDPVRQMLLTITDEDIAWSVIMRLGREFHWRLLDPNTGRELRL